MGPATRTAVVAGAASDRGRSVRDCAVAGHGGRMPHLLAALDHHRGVVVAQQAVPSQGEEGSEIPAPTALLGGIDPARCRGHRGRVALPTRDCHVNLRAWRGLCHNRHGQPAGPAAHTQDAAEEGRPRAHPPSKRHRRRVRRAGRAVTAHGWLLWPAAAHVVQVRRTLTVKGREHIEVVYVISSVPMVQAEPSGIATWIQGHWAIWGHRPLAGRTPCTGCRRGLR